MKGITCDHELPAGTSHPPYFKRVHLKLEDGDEVSELCQGATGLLLYLDAVVTAVRDARHLGGDVNQDLLYLAQDLSEEAARRVFKLGDVAEAWQQRAEAGSTPPGQSAQREEE